MTIKFGTDGWRAVIADDYTFENLKKISKATAVAFQNHPKISNGIVVGYDTRFLSKEFAECSSSVFANHGIKVFLTDSFVTTPTVSLLTKDKNLAYGVMITASHNPAEYNGFKLKDEFGGSMGTASLQLVEKVLNSDDDFEYGNNSFKELIRQKRIIYVAGVNYYVNDLKNKIDVSSISNSNIKIIYD
ncbi:MAG: phosphoglucomutase/phosphomannomutase family protein, partial [Ignavibacteria bacterium]